MKNQKRLGQWGETIAANFLTRKGFEIFAQNWRFGKLGELDLVVYHPQTGLVAFVEVKTRRSGYAGSGEEAVSSSKKKQLIRLAEAFLATYPSLKAINFRFDVLAIYFYGEQPAQIHHYEDAFSNDM